MKSINQRASNLYKSSSLYQRCVLMRCYSTLMHVQGHTTATPAPSQAVNHSPSQAPVPVRPFNGIYANDLGPQYMSNDYVHAWGLLEACLESGNLDRAEFVLLGFAEICSDSADVTLAVNNYLLKLVDLNPEDPTVAKSWLTRMTFLLKDKFRKNSLTEAILLRNAFTSGTLEPFIKLNAKILPSLLNHVEVLGVSTLRAIIQTAGLSPQQMDPKVQDLLEINDKQPLSADETLLGLGKIPEAISKGSFDNLVPTQSVGLRSIRHVLGGLQLTASEKQEINLQPLVQNKVEDGEYFDFFEMSKSLSGEEKEKFDAYLDSVNERRQQAIETRGVEAARMKWKEAFEKMIQLERSGSATKMNLKGLEMLLWQWNQLMVPLINEELELIKELMQYKKKTEVPKEIRAKHGKSFGDRFEYGPFFQLAVIENMPAITMMALVRLNSTRGVADGIKSIKAVLDVGKNIELDYRLRNLKQKESAVLTDSGTGNSGKRQRKAVHNLRSKIRKASLEGSNSWPNYIRAKIGSVLISMFLREAKVTVYGNDPVSGKQVKGQAPAFQHTYQYQGGNKVGVLRPHKVLAKYLTGESAATAIQPQLLPMLVEPRPWTDWNSGGYYYSTSKIIRTKNSPEQLAYVRAAAKRGQLDSVYKGLNVLGRTAWTINKDMFKLISHVWNSKEALLDIPPAVSPEVDLSECGPEPSRSADPTVRRDYMRKVRKASLENAALYSQRCDLNYKLDVARAYIGERFFMPHNLDFRGRAYPLSPHLNHLGNDVSRSLLMFWKGRELGPQGLRWLKIHASNLFGNSKLSFDERVEFIDKHMDDAIDSVENPLNGRKWWQTADDPFQALAALMDIRRAIDSGNPEAYVSHLPVHMDGSCNGLQHYAALGGDIEGAQQVNLVDMERPQDVYSRVLEIVKVDVSEDAANGNLAAATLLPVLTRKVVKQTVMTHVYGVTFIGAREQIANRLKEIDGIPQEKVFSFSAYLANRVMGAVRKLFASAHNIQDWLGENASRISSSIVLQEGVKYDASKKTPEFLSSVIWTTPIGLPIVQPYRQAKRKQVSTELQTVYIHDPYSLQGVNARKQRTAFPPNYVHSLDATHMLLSAIACAEDNISFASVHDSYWTHAGDVDILSHNLRKCFVDLYKRDHIGRLREEFIQRYKDLVQVIYLPENSELGKKVVAAHTEWIYRLYGSGKNRGLHSLVEIEIERLNLIQSGKQVPESPLSLVAKVPTQELEELMRQGNELRKAKAIAVVKKSVPKSTEHAGSGLDLFEKEDALDEIEGDEVLTSTPLGKVIRVFSPLSIPDVPNRGDFDVSSVLDSPYFFS